MDAIDQWHKQMEEQRRQRGNRTRYLAILDIDNIDNIRCDVKTKHDFYAEGKDFSQESNNARKYVIDYIDEHFSNITNAIDKEMLDWSWTRDIWFYNLRVMISPDFEDDHAFADYDDPTCYLFGATIIEYSTVEENLDHYYIKEQYVRFFDYYKKLNGLE